MHETAVLVIQEYVDECLYIPLLHWPKDEFDERCYSRWAANEILERIIEETTRLPQFITGREPMSPLDIIIEFISEVDYCMDVSEDKRTRQLFSAAKDTATDIVLLFL